MIQKSVFESLTLLRVSVRIHNFISIVINLVRLSNAYVALKMNFEFWNTNFNKNPSILDPRKIAQVTGNTFFCFLSFPNYSFEK